MMYALVEIKGKQYRVEEGDTLLVDRMKDEGSVEIDSVLMISDDGETKVGTPYVSGARVKATVTGARAGEKLRIFKYKKRKNYKRRIGHRQKYTELVIDAIERG